MEGESIPSGTPGAGAGGSQAQGRPRPGPGTGDVYFVPGEAQVHVGPGALLHTGWGCCWSTGAPVRVTLPVAAQDPTFSRGPRSLTALSP